MGRKDQIILTYYNVKVPDLIDVQVNADRDPVDYQLIVTDNIIGSDYGTSAVIKVEPTDLSTVSVSPPSVEDGTIQDVTVTYTAQDTVYGDDNAVTIGLPEGWEPAHAPYDDPRTFNSFGDEALPKAPRDSKRNTTSYVVLTTNVKSDTSGKTCGHDSADSRN